MYKENFHSICAIDESYVYVLVLDGKSYNVVRIAKNGIFSARQILEGVKKVVYQDKEYIYLVEEISPNSITRVHRSRLLSSDIVTFKDKIVDVSEYKEPHSGKYYVLTYRYNMLESTLGGNCNYCYVIDKDGNILEDFEKAGSYDEFMLAEYDNSYVAYDLRSDDIWTDAYAESVTWVPKNGTETVLMESEGGWKVSESGTFVIEDNREKIGGDEEENGALPYLLAIYKEESGKKTNIIPVNSTQIFRTIRNMKITDYSSSGKEKEISVWYFIDEDKDGKWILYELSPNLIGGKKIKEIETNADLETCSINIMDNTLYIYSLKDGMASKFIDIYEY